MLEKAIHTADHSVLKLVDVIGKLYFMIAEIELNSGKGWILKNELRREYEGNFYSWSALLLEKLPEIYPEDRPKMLISLSLDSLAGMADRREHGRRLELRLMRENGLPGWMEVEISVISYEERKLLVTARNIAEQRLFQNIVELYVYSSCDYFIYVDLRKNQYEMLWGREGEPTIPPRRSADYVCTFMMYIDENVVEEDRERMKREILPDNILTVLEQKKEHACYYGLMEPGRGYTRKRIQYLYYDRTTQTVLLSRTDVTVLFLESKRQNEALRCAEKQAQRDPLTDIYNQRTIKQLIEEKLVDGSCTEGAFLFIDLDNFKQVNDIQGHQKGDEVLRYVAAAIRGSLRSKHDLIGRVGGDEFIIFIGNLSSRQEIERCAGRLHGAIRRYAELDFSLTCSIGISRYPQDGVDYETLFKRADAAMYQAKTAGKSGYAWWGADEDG